MSKPEYGVNVSLFDTTLNPDILSILEQSRFDPRVTNMARAIIELGVGGLEVPGYRIKGPNDQMILSIDRARQQYLDQAFEDGFIELDQLDVPVISVLSSPRKDIVEKDLSAISRVPHKQLIIPEPVGKDNTRASTKQFKEMFNAWAFALTFKAEQDEEIPIGISINIDSLRVYEVLNKLLAYAIEEYGVNIINFTSSANRFSKEPYRLSKIIDIISYVESLYDDQNEDHYEVTYATDFHDNDGFGVENNLSFIKATLAVAEKSKKVINLQIHSNSFGLKSGFKTNTDIFGLASAVNDYIYQEKLDDYITFRFNKSKLIEIAQRIIDEAALGINANDLNLV